MFRFDADQSKNFLDTFGYLSLKLPKEFDYELFAREVNKIASKQFSLSWDQITKSKQSCVVQPFADMSDVASEFLVHSLNPIIEKLLGKNYFYLSSDASIFFAPGSAWHRDMAMPLTVLKLLVYLDFDSQQSCCDFMAIPGSHHVHSNYAGLLQRSMAWPDVYAHAGGLTENGFLPGSSDPTDPCYPTSDEVIPIKTVRVNPGTAIIFNQATIHAVKSFIRNSKPRRLVTYVFCANPADLPVSHYTRDPLGKSLSDGELLEDIYNIYAMQYQRLGICDYGDSLKNYPKYIEAHGINWNKIIDASNKLGNFLQKEDGTHSTVQAAKMKEFLLKSIPSVENHFNE